MFIKALKSTSVITGLRQLFCVFDVLFLRLTQETVKALFSLMFYLFFKRIVFVFLVQTTYNKYAIYTKMILHCVLHFFCLLFVCVCSSTLEAKIHGLCRDILLRVCVIICDFIYYFYFVFIRHLHTYQRSEHKPM